MSEERGFEEGSHRIVSNFKTERCLLNRRDITKYYEKSSGSVSRILKMICSLIPNRLLTQDPSPQPFGATQGVSLARQ